MQMSLLRKASLSSLQTPPFTPQMPEHWQISQIQKILRVSWPFAKFRTRKNRLTWLKNMELSWLWMPYRIPEMRGPLFEQLPGLGPQEFSAEQELWIFIILKWFEAPLVLQVFCPF